MAIEDKSGTPRPEEVLELMGIGKVSIPSRECILKSLVVERVEQPGPIQELWRYAYRHPDSAREFTIRQFVNSDRGHQFQFFLEEIRPTGKALVTDSTGNSMARDDARVLELEALFGPNYFIRLLARENIPEESVMFVGSGFSGSSIYYDSVEASIEAIVGAIEKNQRYVSQRELNAGETASVQHREAVQSVEYWHSEADALRKSEERARGLFKGCYNMFGPLPQEVYVRVLAYLNHPTQEAWVSLRTCLVAGPTTLWEAWVKTDRRAPDRGDEDYPSPETLRQAIRNAVEERKQQIEAKLKEVGPRGLRSVPTTRQEE